MADIRAPRLIPVRVGDVAARSGADVCPGDDAEAEVLTTVDVAHLDWQGATLRECALALTGVAELVLDRCRLVECRLAEPDVTSVRGRDGTWRAVEVVGGRVPALDLAGCTWDGVAVSGSRLGYVNLRDATLIDVVLDGCRIDTLDLAGATAERVRLRDCVVDELIVTRATLRDVDLREARIEQIEGVIHLAGATISVDQLVGLAAGLAAELGIRVAD